MDKVSAVIIGAGVVGLAIAAKLSEKYSDLVLLEKESSFGQGTSSRNSEVIHAGIYYEKDSLKARLCVEGNRLLYDFCEKNNISHSKIGKLIVAMSEDEIASLHKLEQKARANGVANIQWLTKKQAEELEPAISACAALYSADTGIIDSHSLMKCLEQTAKNNGAMLSYSSEVTSIQKTTNGYIVEINKEYSFETERLVNSAGLFSDKIAAMVGIDIVANRYQLHYCKGEYFSYRKPSFLKRLVYPVPEQDIKGLGIHSVIDLSGALKFGPSAEYVDRIDYAVDPDNRIKFFNAIKDMFPQISIDDLFPNQAGVRPKLQGPKEGVRDFVIQEEKDKGLPGFINLIGIESPGLTACLAVAEQVAKFLKIV